MENSQVIGDAKGALKHFFGYDSFRPMQEDIVNNVMEGNDTLVLMPTGGGKSLCFQVPAIIKEGVALVVSPLIALMKDQVEGLMANGVPAAYLNSSQSDRQQQEVLKFVREEKVKLLYVSPEKAVSPAFQGFVKYLNVSLLAIDEAHCISSWGHDFRPEYTQLKDLRAFIGDAPIIALTATADKVTRTDIVSQLGLNDPKVFLDSFDRPNLSLNVRPAKDRVRKIMDFIDGHPGQSGIIYCLSRKSTEQLADKLRNAGYSAGHYHAQMGVEKRNNVQEAFIKDELQIICATIAFGMGIDKSNVRWVIHYNLPKNIEGYYQEIGRAGRDGLPADTLLFYSYADTMILREFAESSGQKELQLAKLERMQYYAEALICRRRILLSYFGESVEKDCGNCDVCRNPPKFFDGAILAQKALSAVARLPEGVSIGVLIDVLRGSRRAEILQKGYDKIKTYGAGADVSAFEWQMLIQQMLNIGLMDIAYDQKNILKLNDTSKKVLFEKQSVKLVQLQELQQNTEKRKKQEKPLSKKETFRRGLLQRLTELRKSIADQQNVAPYLVFSDATIKDMAEKMPANKYLLSEIQGVSDSKLSSFGNAFVNAIVTYIKEQFEQGNKMQGTTAIVTFAYYLDGLSIEEMAKKRGFATNTISTHLVTLVDEKYPVDLFKFFDQEELEVIQSGMRKLGKECTLNNLFDYFNGEIAFERLRLAMAV